MSNTPNVGFLVWSCSFVLAEYLFKHPPHGRASWTGVRVLELGAGTGVVGIAMAMAGADVTMTDLAHITPLTRENVGLNAGSYPLGTCPTVGDYQWGRDPAHLGDRFEVVLAADCVYEAQYYPDLLQALRDTCTPNALIYCCYKKRRLREEVFEQAVETEGFRLTRVPDADLGGDHKAGEYRLLLLQLPQDS